jgi:hypothetical protein
MNCFHRTCFHCQVLHSTTNLPLWTRFLSCLMNGSCQKAQVFINIGHYKKSKFSYFFSKWQYLIFNPLPQFCISISGPLIFCGWFMAIHITVTHSEPWHFDPHATHIICNSLTAFLHQPTVSRITFFFTLWGGRECITLNRVSLQPTVHKLLNQMYQFFTPSHQFPFVILPELCSPAEVFLCHTRFQANILFHEYRGWWELLPQLAYNILYYLSQTILLYNLLFRRKLSTQFQALSVSRNLQIIFLGRFLPQKAYLLIFFKQKSEDTVQLIAVHLGAIQVDLCNPWRAR